jgi:hypothetical protein
MQQSNKIVTFLAFASSFCPLLEEKTAPGIFGGCWATSAAEIIAWTAS